MSIEYLLVVYNGDRDVLADGDRVGVTNHTILLAPDEYTITLSGDGYAPPSEDVILEAINSGCARRIVVIAVNARADMDNGVGKNPAVPGLLKVVNTVIGAPIDSTTARSNASLQDLVDMLKNQAPRPPGRPANRCLPDCGSTTFPSILISSRLSNTNCRPRLQTSVRAGTFRPYSCRNLSTPGGSCCGSILAFSACCSI
jgi:hypothetical protein